MKVLLIAIMLSTGCQTTKPRVTVCVCETAVVYDCPLELEMDQFR